MEEADKDWMMIRMVGGWVFLLVPAHPGSPGQTAVKRLLLLLLLGLLKNCSWVTELAVGRFCDSTNVSQLLSELLRCATGTHHRQSMFTFWIQDYIARLVPLVVKMAQFQFSPSKWLHQIVLMAKIAAVLKKPAHLSLWMRKCSSLQ